MWFADIARRRTRSLLAEVNGIYYVTCAQFSDIHAKCGLSVSSDCDLGRPQCERMHRELVHARRCGTQPALAVNWHGCQATRKQQLSAQRLLVFAGCCPSARSAESCPSGLPQSALDAALTLKSSQLRRLAGGVAAGRSPEGKDTIVFRSACRSGSNRARADRENPIKLHARSKLLSCSPRLLPGYPTWRRLWRLAREKKQQPCNFAPHVVIY